MQDKESRKTELHKLISTSTNANEILEAITERAKLSGKGDAWSVGYLTGVISTINKKRTTQ